MTMLNSVAPTLLVDAWLLANSLLLPIVVFFPGLLMMMDLPGMKGSARLRYHTEPYLGCRRARVLMSLLMCRRLPSSLLARRWAVPARLKVAPSLSASPGLVTRGRAASCPRQFSVGRRATSAYLPLGVGAGDATIHSACPAQGTAARARPPSEEGALAAMTIIVRLVIIIMIFVPRVAPCGPTRSAATAAALMRSTSWLTAAGLAVARGRCPRRALVTKICFPCG